MRILVLGFFLLSACSNTTTVIQGLDVSVFKEDRGSCEGKRLALVEKLKKEKEAFLGMTENEVLDLLGRYDVQVLDRRQKKIFIYFLEPGPHCELTQNASDATQSMAIRFNAVSLVNEVSFQQGIP